MSSPSQDADLDRLKTVAGRMDDLFGMEMPDAPGFSFVGARFGVEAGARGGPWRFSAGAADPDRQRAFRRCVGEATETLSQFLSLRPGPEIETFDRPSGLDEEERRLLEALAGADAMRAGWVEAGRLPDGRASRLPAALLFRDAVPGDAVLSLGCAAGRSVDAATLSALFELIERDALALWWRGGRQAAAVAGAELDAAVAAMRAGETARRTWFLDLTTDIGVPVAAALSCGRDGRGVEAGFAARATFQGAARAALRELAQMELGSRLVAIKAEHGGTLAEPERRQLERMTVLHADDPWLRGEEGARAHAALAGEDRETAAAIAALLGRAGVEAHLADLTNPALGIPVVKAVAPLLQGEPATVVTPRLARAREASGIGDGGVSPCEIV